MSAGTSLGTPLTDEVPNEVSMASHTIAPMAVAGVWNAKEEIGVNGS